MELRRKLCEDDDRPINISLRFMGNLQCENVTWMTNTMPCISACINIRARAAFASCFYGSEDTTHSHTCTYTNDKQRDCQEVSVCIRAKSLV